MSQPSNVYHNPLHEALAELRHSKNVEDYVLYVLYVLYVQYVPVFLPLALLSDARPGIIFAARVPIELVDSVMA